MWGTVSQVIAGRAYPQRVKPQGGSLATDLVVSLEKVSGMEGEEMG